MATLQRSNRGVQVSPWKKIKTSHHFSCSLVSHFGFPNVFLGIFSNNAVRPHTYQGRVIKFHRSTIWQIRLLIAYFQPLFHGNFLVKTSQVDQISFFQIILGWKLSNQCTGQGSQLNFLTQQSKIMRVCTFATLPILDGTTTKGV